MTKFLRLFESFHKQDGILGIYKNPSALELRKAKVTSVKEHGFFRGTGVWYPERDEWFVADMDCTHYDLLESLNPEEGGADSVLIHFVPDRKKITLSQNYYAVWKGSGSRDSVDPTLLDASPYFQHLKSKGWEMIDNA